MVSQVSWDEAWRSAPADVVAITSDGGVKKIVLRPGEGAEPPLHARCLVHYVGWLVESGDKFMDTAQESASAEPAVLVAGRDSVLRERGLHLAVATMTTGERARLWVSPEYGFGDKGSFSFPTIPPHSPLVYEMELVDYEPPPQGGGEGDATASGMTYEERLEASERRRMDGNTAFGQERYREALGRYAAALSFVDEDLLMQLEGFHYDKAIDARVPALLNSAACHIKLGDYRAAVTVASQALSERPGEPKALFRRGAARHALGQTEEALEDLMAAQRGAPGDAGVARELAAVRRTLLEVRAANASLFRGIVDKNGGLGGREEGGTRGRSGGEQEGAALLRAPTGGATHLEEPLWKSFLRALCPFAFGRKPKEY